MKDRKMDSSLLAVLLYAQITVCFTFGTLIYAWADRNTYPAENVAAMAFACFVSVAPLGVLILMGLIGFTRSENT